MQNAHSIYISLICLSLLFCVYAQDMLHEAEASVRQAADMLRPIYQDENAELVSELRL